MATDVNTSPMTDTSFVLEIGPQANGVDLRSWCEVNRPRIRELLLEHGVILFRGFSVEASGFADVAGTLAPGALEYQGGSSARQKVDGNVYLSTTFPPQYTLMQHYEMAYMRRWPLKVLFYCDTPSPIGGETPVASSRALMQRLDPRIVETFTERKVMYVRDMGKDFIKTWQATFETTDKSVAEAHAKKLDLQLEWLDDDRLRMRHVAQGTARHPETGELTWFNSAHIFHEKLREIPNNGMSCYFGDGSDIDVGMLRDVREALEQTRVAFPWQHGDVMLIDNMLASHGRMPFSGPRRILAWLASSYSPDDQKVS